MANCYGSNRIQNITQTLKLFEAAEENYRDDALLRVLFLDTPGHPTSAPQYSNSSKYTIYMHITIRNLSIASASVFFFPTRGVMEEKKI